MDEPAGASDESPEQAAKTAEDAVVRPESPERAASAEDVAGAGVADEQGVVSPAPELADDGSSLLPADESPQQEGGDESPQQEGGDESPQQGGFPESPAVEHDSGDEEDEEEEEELDEDVEPLELIEEETQEEEEKRWYILKVQSNRESSIRDGLQRRVAVAGLDRYFGEIIVPTEDVAEFKNGKKRIIKRKLYPGYVVVNMVLNDDTWFLVRETPGIGDFTGAAGRPTPMQFHEVQRILKASKPEDDGGEPVKTAIPFKQGDRVRIKEGTFENFEGEVDDIDEANGRVTVMINIFGRSTPAELEHWQIESL